MEPKDSLPHSQEPDTCLYLSHINPNHAYLSHFFKTILILSSQLHPGLPSGLFSSDFPTKTLY